VLPLLTDLPTIGRGPHPAPDPLDVHVWRHDHGASIGPERISALLALLSPDEHTRASPACATTAGDSISWWDARCVGTFCRVMRRSRRKNGGSRWAAAVSPLSQLPPCPRRCGSTCPTTDGVSVCAVTGAGPEIGIDIERIALGRDALEIAEQFFPEVEVNALRLLPAAQRGETFVRIWALKESFVKARETSLADGIRGTAFDLARPDDIGVTFCEPLHERAQEWQFNLFRLDLARIVALAVRTQTTGPLSLRAETCLEL